MIDSCFLRQTVWLFSEHRTKKGIAIDRFFLVYFRHKKITHLLQPFLVPSGVIFSFSWIIPLCVESKESVCNIVIANVQSWDVLLSVEWRECEEGDVLYRKLSAF